MNDYGISDHELDQIINSIAGFPKIEKAILFGSRAIGSFRPGSDIDIALYGDIPFDDFLSLSVLLSDLDILQKVDLLKVDDSVDVEVLKHIDRVGVALFERSLNSGIVSYQIKVKGKVQGVFFRASTKSVADKLGIKGWVKNEKDGSVSIVAEGERAKLEEFRKWCESGPEFTHMSSIEVSEIDEQNFESFEIAY